MAHYDAPIQNVRRNHLQLRLTTFMYDSTATAMTHFDACSFSAAFSGDHLDSARLMTNASGGIVPGSEGTFLPYGQEFGPTTNSNHYKFTGKERDSESGLDYFGARFYSNAHGRWFSPDWADKPISVPYAEFGDPQSLNLYGYVRNSPMSKADADGHCPWCPLAIAAGGPVGVAVAGGVLLTAAYLATPQGKAAATNAMNSLGQMVTTAVHGIDSMVTRADDAASKQPPPVIIDGNKHPETAQHVADAQAAGHPSEVTLDRANAPGNRKDALRGTPPVAGKHRDEYPPAATKEGGDSASVRTISGSDNSGAGASFGNQVRPYPDGTVVKIIPVNVPKPPK